MYEIQQIGFVHNTTTHSNRFIVYYLIVLFYEKQRRELQKKISNYIHNRSSKSRRIEKIQETKWKIKKMKNIDVAVVHRI